jgi:hypothetical protein
VYTALAFDIEANGFKPSEIFCISVTDLITLDKSFYPPEAIPDVCLRLSEADLLVGHYIRGYDCPVIEKLTQGLVIFEKSRLVDTLDMSKALTTNKKHSLQVWGDFLGIPKLSSPLFEQYTPEMIPYCNRDVEITVELFYHLLEMYLNNPKPFRNHEALDIFVTEMVKATQG